MQRFQANISSSVLFQEDFQNKNLQTKKISSNEQKPKQNCGNNASIKKATGQIFNFGNFSFKKTLSASVLSLVFFSLFLASNALASNLISSGPTIVISEDSPVTAATVNDIQNSAYSLLTTNYKLTKFDAVARAVIILQAWSADGLRGLLALDNVARTSVANFGREMLVVAKDNHQIVWQTLQSLQNDLAPFGQKTKLAVGVSKQKMAESVGHDLDYLNKLSKKKLFNSALVKAKVEKTKSQVLTVKPSMISAKSRLQVRKLDFVFYAKENLSSLARLEIAEVTHSVQYFNNLLKNFVNAIGESIVENRKLTALAINSLETDVSRVEKSAAQSTMAINKISRNFDAIGHSLQKDLSRANSIKIAKLAPDFSKIRLVIETTAHSLAGDANAALKKKIELPEKNLETPFVQSAEKANWREYVKTMEDGLKVKVKIVQIRLAALGQETKSDQTTEAPSGTTTKISSPQKSFVQTVQAEYKNFIKDMSWAGNGLWPALEQSLTGMFADVAGAGKIVAKSARLDIVGEFLNALKIKMLAIRDAVGDRLNDWRNKILAFLNFGPVSSPVSPSNFAGALPQSADKDKNVAETTPPPPRLPGIITKTVEKIITGPSVSIATILDAVENTYLDFKKGATVSGDLAVTGAVTIKDQFYFNPAMGTLTVPQGAIETKNLRATGVVDFSGATVIGLPQSNGGFTNNTYYIGSSAGNSSEVLSRLTVHGNSNLESTLNVSGAASFSSNLSVGGTLGVTGAATFADILNVNGSTTSTFANGIQLSSGCFRLPSGSCAGTGSGSSDANTSSTLTTGQIISTSTATSTFVGGISLGSTTGGLYIQTNGGYPQIQFSATGTFLAAPTDTSTGAAGFVLNTAAALVNAKILSLQEAGSEKAYIDFAGGVYGASSTFGGTSTLNNLTIRGTCTGTGCANGALFASTSSLYTGYSSSTFTAADLIATSSIVMNRTATNASGTFYVDSSGNISSSGSIVIPTVFVVDTSGNITTSGTMHINNTGNSYFLGNVGIGTVAPSYPLHVSTTGLYGTVIERTNNAQDSVILALLHTRGSGVAGQNGDDAGELSFATNNSAGVNIVAANIFSEFSDVTSGAENGVLYIRTRQSGTYGTATLTVRDGRLGIGIGTTAPLSTLEVNGGAAIGSYAGTVAAPSNSLIVSGMVGIGTTSGTARLNVVNGGIDIGTGSATTTVSSTFFVLNKTATNTSGTFYVDPSGNISSSGSFQIPNKFVLDTSGNLTTSGTLRIQGTSTSTLAGGLIASQLNINGTAGSSTFANGIRLTGGCFLDAAGNCLLSSNYANTALSNLSAVAINVSLLPSSDNAIDLGSNAKRWQNGYFGNSLNSSSSILSDNFFAIAKTNTNASGTFYIDSSGNTYTSGSITSFGDVGIRSGAMFMVGVNAANASGTFHVHSDGSLSTSGTIFGNGTNNLFSFNRTATNASGTFYLDRSGNIYTSGSIRSFGSLLPSADNTYDLGSQANRWRTLYIGTNINSSGTILSDNSFAIAKTNTNASGTFYVDSSGNVNTSGTLNVFGQATSTFTGGLFLATSSTFRVGIGTTTPRAKLDAPDIITSALTLSRGTTLSSLTGFNSQLNLTNNLGIRDTTFAKGSTVLNPQINLINIGTIQSGGMTIRGGGTFAAKVDYTASTTPYLVAIGDLNGDGKNDMAVANNGVNGVSVLINNGDGSFAAKVDYTTGPRPSALAIGDLNGDGKNDLVTSNLDADSLGATASVLINNGDGTFTSKVDYTTGVGARSVAIGDLNGDGKNDFAVTNYGSGGAGTTVSVFINKGDGTFAARADFTVGTGPVGVAIGDLNGDGKNDIVATNFGGGAIGTTVSVLINNGNGTFAAKADYGTGNSPIGVAIGDLNGDGKNDLAVANYNSTSASVLINNGDGTLATKVDYTTGANPFDPAIGDLNGDGKNDLALANSGPSNASVFINNGDGTLATKVDYTTGSSPFHVAFGDLNGDGKNDLATANSGAGTVSVLLNNATTLFYADPVTGQVSIGTASSSARLTVLGGSGLDIGNWTSTTTVSSTFFVLNKTATNASGTFYLDPSGNIFSSGSFQIPNKFVLDSSGNLTTSGTLRIQGTSTSTLAGGLIASQLYINGTAGSSTFANGIRLTGGCFLDAAGNCLLSSNYANTALSNLSAVAINVSLLPSSDNAIDLGSNAKRWQNGYFGNSLNSSSSILSDNFFAIAKTNTNASGTFYVDSSGNVNTSGTLNVFGQATSTFTGGLFLATSSTFRVGIGTTTPRAKLDAPDIITSALTLSRGNTLSALTGFNSQLNLTNNLGIRDTTFAKGSTVLNPQINLINIGTIQSGGMTIRGGGTFAAKVDYTVGTGPGYAIISDIDGDGWNDLAVTNITSGSVSLLLNNGDSNGTFVAKVDSITPSTPVELTSGDFNGDGKNDVVVANNGSGVNTISVFINNATSTFATRVDYSVGTGPWSVVSGDFNGDGKIDLAVVNKGANTFSVLLNKGDGTFATAVNYNTGTDPRGMAMGDLNGDGKNDVVVANYNSNLGTTISVYINNGDGTFAAAVNYTTGTGPVSVAIGDLNGDGKNDLAIANNGTSVNTVSILFNKGDGTFTTKVDYTTGTSPAFVAIGDLNGDGKNDLATANYGANTVSVLQNNGNGTFATKVDYAVGTGPNSVAVGDLNGDGKNDLVTANNGTTTVSVLLNNATTLFYADPVTGQVSIGTASSSARLTVLGGSGLDIGNWTSTTTVSSTFFMLNKTATNASGTFYVDPSGNIYTSGSFQIPNKFVLDTSGNLTTSGTLRIQGTSTSTLAGGLIASQLYINGTAGSSTFANGIRLTAGCFLLPDNTCAGAGGGGGANTALSNLASVAINLSLIANSDNAIDLGSNAKRWQNGYFGNSLNSSSSILSDNFFAIAKTTADASGTFYVDSSGNVNTSGTLTLTNAGIVVASTTVTSTFSGPVVLNSDLEAGMFEFPEDAGEVTWVNLPITTALATGTVQSYTAKIDYLNVLTVYGEADGSGNAQNPRVGIALPNSTTTPQASLDVQGALGLYSTSGTIAGTLTINKIVATTTATSTFAGGLQALALNITGTTTSTFAGSIKATKGITANCTGACIDLAEAMPSVEPTEPGDVVEVISTTTVRKSQTAYSSRVAGVVSTNPAILFEGARVSIGGWGNDPMNPSIALAGRVPVKVTNESGRIMAGDLLVSASKPGYAMKYDESLAAAAGAKNAGVIGVAMEDMLDGVPESSIVILLRSGFKDATLAVTQNSSGQILNTTLAADLDLGGFNILNIRSLQGAGGKWSISEDGSLVSKEVKTEKITVTVTDQTQSVGTAKVLAGQATVTVQNALVKSDSKLFITWKQNPGASWWISRQEDGWFEISLASPAAGDTSFDYLIIGVDNEQTPPPPPPAPLTTSTPETPPPTPEPSPAPATESSPTPSPTPEPASTSSTTESSPPASETPPPAPEPAP